MKNILIPTDFSQNSWNAIQYSLEFFKKTSCNFYLLHVTTLNNYVDDDSSVLPTMEVVDHAILKQAKTELQKLSKKVKSQYPNPLHNFVAISSHDYFIDAVRDHTYEKNIDLIVMGTKGANGIKKAVVGSNTSDLITKVQCPVLVVPEKAVYRIPKEMAFPTNFNIFFQTKILSNISEFVKMYDSSLRILHIAKNDEKLTVFQEENKEYLNDFFMDEKHSFHKITNKKIDAGVQYFVESRNIDMIIMIAKNLNLFQQILFKPTAERISYHTDIPFLVLHE